VPRSPGCCIGLPGGVRSSADVKGTEVAGVDLEEFVRQFKAAVNEFAKGNPEPTKALFSHGDDVTLANPFGPIAKGWDEVSEALSYASSRFRDGEVTAIERIADYASGDLACHLDRESWRARVGEREDSAMFELRVTTALRREDSGWKIVHRHADPITTFDASGPIRGSQG
jgi:ketosteroid isomerase-like protein